MKFSKEERIFGSKFLLLKTKKALLFLFIFANFLVTPSLVCYINSQVDISYVFSLAEEEKKASKEVEFNTSAESNFSPIFEVSKGIFYTYLNEAIKSVYLNLISPPPKELV